MLLRLAGAVRNMKLRSKLLLSYLIVVLLPVILIGYFLVTRTTDTVLKQTGNISRINFNQLKGNIYNLMKSYLTFTDSVVLETQLMEYLNRDYTSGYEYLDIYRDYINISGIFTNKFSMQNGEAVSIYTTNESLMEDYKFIQISNDSIKNEEWYRKVLAAKGVDVIFGPYVNQSGETVFAIGRVLTTYADSKYTNVVKVEIPESNIYSLMEKEGVNKKVYLLDGNNTIISSSDRSKLGKKLQDISEINGIKLIPSELSSLNLNNNRSILFYGFFQGNDVISNWKVASIVSSEEMLENITEIVRYSLLICLASFLVAIIFMILFSNKISKRLERLVHNMSKIREGSFDVFVGFEEMDEIGVLSKSFKNMVDRINNLINEVYVLDIKKKEAEINALQSQINPHFLFNTMESVRMNLWKKRDFETSEIIQKFAKLLRKSIDWSSYNILLIQELDLVGTYLEIQKYRYTGKLDYEINVDEAYYDYAIPKFILQPIVENAIYHGIEMKKGKGKLAVFSKTDESRLIIIVQDDGIGMGEAELAAVRQNIYSEQLHSGSGRIGVRNVHQRIKLHFGNAYGLEIHSEKDKGTVVEICLPLTTMEGISNV